jgi:methylated-DNA-[protein]-cysteine S-methyltransferase
VTNNRQTLALRLDRVPTAIGVLLIVTDGEQQLRAVDWHDFEPRMLKLLRLHYGATGYALQAAPVASSIRSVIEAYFAGDLAAIDSLPVATRGTAFQRSVWNALRKIPVGRTTSYGELAGIIGHPKAVRAVGLANGSNPVGIVVPCHRVIGANASLTGYGGGLERKRWLLQHEGALQGAGGLIGQMTVP